MPDPPVEPNDAAHALQNTVKNNLCATGTPVSVTFFTFKQLQKKLDQKIPAALNWGRDNLPADRTGLKDVHTTSDGDTIGEGSVVQSVGLGSEIEDGREGERQLSAERQEGRQRPAHRPGQDVRPRRTGMRQRHGGDHSSPPPGVVGRVGDPSGARSSAPDDRAALLRRLSSPLRGNAAARSAISPGASVELGDPPGLQDRCLQVQEPPELQGRQRFRVDANRSVGSGGLARPLTPPFSTARRGVGFTIPPPGKEIPV